MKQGQWLAFLRKSQLLDATIVLTADHGARFGEKHDDPHHVPLVVRPPHGTARENVVEQVEVREVLGDVVRRAKPVTMSSTNELGRQSAGRGLEPQALKAHWLELSAQAEPEIERAGTAGIDVGVAFVNGTGALGWFDDPGYRPHRLSRLLLDRPARHAPRDP